MKHVRWIWAAALLARALAPLALWGTSAPQRTIARFFAQRQNAK
jgi:hypothetical protein